MLNLGASQGTGHVMHLRAGGLSDRVFYFFQGTFPSHLSNRTDPTAQFKSSKKERKPRKRNSLETSPENKALQINPREKKPSPENPQKTVVPPNTDQPRYTCERMVFLATVTFE